MAMKFCVYSISTTLHYKTNSAVKEKFHLERSHEIIFFFEKHLNAHTNQSICKSHWGIKYSRYQATRKLKLMNLNGKICAYNLKASLFDIFYSLLPSSAQKFLLPGRTSHNSSGFCVLFGPNRL